MNVASPTGDSTIGEEEKTNLSIGSSEIGGMTMCSPMLTVQAAPTSASLLQGGCGDTCPSVNEKDEVELQLHI
jgi:hypothetical protein